MTTFVKKLKGQGLAAQGHSGHCTWEKYAVKKAFEIKGYR